MPEDQILTISCPDRPGLLADFCSSIASHGGNLLEVNQFTDTDAGWFFSRYHFIADQAEALRTKLEQKACALQACLRFTPLLKPLRTAILVSHESHCLQDILWRWKSGELKLDIAAVIGNHETCRTLVEREGLPFVYTPVQTDKQKGFTSIAEHLQKAGAELVILARFMQIIPPWLCQQYPNAIINIHHSFLPAFVGANPYLQAYRKGVKVIGATCHYINENLDEGPIIEQEVMRVEHHHDKEDLVRLGRDCERMALSRGVRYHSEHRIFVHNNKTIVFRD